MNLIQEIWNEDVENITKVYLSDGVWYDVICLEILGHFGEKPQYFALETQVNVPPLHLKKICGKISDIKLIEVEYNQ